MDSWDQESPSPDVKFEASPAESFLSMPGEMYPPLFGTSTPAGSVATMNPLEIMTPQSFSDDKKASDAAGLAASTAEDAASSPTSTGEKRQTKKRKSWGQVLPEPKTNLPPRKRAKTEDEKEQRRVERVLRNRRAAQSSRERKRLEVEALEKRNQELEDQLQKVQDTNLRLYRELSKLRGASGVGVATRSPLTLTPELFSSQDGHSRLVEQNKPSLDELMMTMRAQTTINPTSLSPALGPVSDAAIEDLEAPAGDLAASEPAESGEASPDLTQHPAVSVGGSFPDLDGLPAADVSGPIPLLSANPLADIHFDDAFDLQASIDADRYVLESQLLATPNSSTSEYDCVASDAAFAFPTTTDFDFDDFLNDETTQQPSSSGGNLVSGLAAEPTRDNPETEASPEDPNLQPHAGASAYGCDNGGLAVGAF